MRGFKELGGFKEVGVVVDILMMIVWDEEQIDNVLCGENGVFQFLCDGVIVFVMSIMLFGYCKEFVDEVVKGGVWVLDCLVSGFVIGVKDGIFFLMIGGDEDVIEEC